MTQPTLAPGQPLAIRIWSEFRELLHSEASPYLDLAKFVVQKDAFLRLADEDVASDVPWLTYDYTEITSDEALAFALYLYSGGFELSMGPVGLSIPYESFAVSATETIKRGTGDDQFEADPRKIAQHILTTVKLLLNGQLALGCSWRKGELVAVETFLLGFETKPYPIGLSGSFSLFKRSAHDYAVKQNRVLPGRIRLTSEFPLVPPVVNGQRVRRGREVDSIEGLDPLTKPAFEELATQADLHEYTGKDTREGVWSHFYGSIEFWLVTAGVVSGFAWLKYSPHSPTLFHNEWLQPVYVVLSWVIIPYAVGYLLGLKQASINAGGRPLTYRIERAIASWGIGTFGYLRLSLLGLSVGLLPVGLWLKVWTPRADMVHLYGAIELLGQIPQLWIPIGLNTLVIGLIATNRIYGSRWGRALIAAISSGYAISISVINEMYMNVANSAPQPSDWAITAILLLPILLAVLAIVAFWRGRHH